MLRAWGGIAYRFYIAAIIAGVVMAAVLALYPPATTALHTVAFAVQTLPVPVKVQPWLAPEPERRATTFRRDDGVMLNADVYVIPDGRRAGLLVFLGANAAGADDPEVVNLGQALARAGFAVMYYWSPTMGQQAQIDAGEIANLVAAFERLRQLEYVDPQRVGLAGFSVGASLALVAAADPRIADDIAFVNAFGGYYDAADLLAQIAAGRAFDAGAEIPWQVDPLTRQVFSNMLAGVADTPAARDLLAGADSIAQARQWYADLPPDFRAQVEAISPSRHIGGLGSGTAIRVMHDRGDALIPVGESRRLVAALGGAGSAGPAVYYTETDIFRHVRPDAAGNWRSLLQGAGRLCRHMYHIIAVARQPG